MASLSRWVVAALVVSSTANPLSPQQRAPAIPAGVQLDSPLDPAFKRADKPTPPPVGFPNKPPQPTKPTKTPALPESAVDITIGDGKASDSDGKTCTHTVTAEKLKDSPCRTDGVLSVHRSWAMLTKTVDCKGCQDVYLQASTYYCPINEIRTTEWVPTATTYTTYVCGTTKSGADAREAPPLETSAPEPEARRRWEGQGEAHERRQQITWSGSGGVVQLGCPTTYVIQPKQTAGVTWTDYRSWATKTEELPCGGCPLVTSTAVIGVGQAGRFKTTITMPIGTSTAYKCQ